MTKDLEYIEKYKAEIDNHKKSFFNNNEYAFFMFGVFILGGILVLPLLWRFGIILTYIGSRYIYIFPLSLVLCAFIFVAFRRNGTISWIRVIPSGLIITIIVPTIIKELTGKTVPPISDVLLGFAILMLCGYIGIIFARLKKNK